MKPGSVPSRSAARKLIFTCSGAADVGEITDRAARQLTREGAGTMSCLASIAAGVPDILFNAQTADRLLAMDGCPTACARHTLEQAGFNAVESFHLLELGLRKGQSPATPENIALAVKHAARLLARPPKAQRQPPRTRGARRAGRRSARGGPAPARPGGGANRSRKAGR
ncbi:MAG: putative zinc-binding protein [Verrucomicrobia bacterium]|nr:putative zinc-binding protein [Verrucomicrobiota bacterium]